MTLQDMLDQKGRLVGEADQILKAAKEEGRMDLRAEEETKFNAIHADIEKLTKRVEMEMRQQAAAQSLESNGRRSEPNPIQNETRNQRESRIASGKLTDFDRTEALRSWMLYGKPGSEISDSQRAIAARCGLPVEAKSITLRLAPKALTSLVPEEVRAWERDYQEHRAALTGAQSTTTTGGYTVADSMMRSLEVALLQFGAMRSVATVIRTDTGGPLPIPTVNDTSNKGAILAENTGASELEMTFGQLTLDAWKYSSKYVLASVEFIQDSSIDVNGYLGTALANRIGRITNDHFTTGDGSSKPQGVVNASSSGVTGVADPPTHDNLQDLLHKVDPAYRPNARWMMNDNTLKSIKKIKVLQYSGDTVGIPLWSPGLTLGAPDTIIGFPYVINQSMADPGSAAKKLLFGDFSKYVIRDVRDVTLLRLDERFADAHQVAFLAFSRHDGDLLDAGTHPVYYMSQT